MSLPSSLRLKKNPVSEMKEEPFLSNKKPLPSSLKIKKQNPQFEGESEEETERNIERNQARTLSRMGESVLGAPGDIASFISGVFGKEQNILPTSQKLKQYSEKASQGYTKAKNETEENFDELSSDIVSMTFPGAGGYGFVRNIGIPIVANLIKEGFKYGKSSDKTQSYAKIGTMVALDLATRNKGGVKAHIDSLFSKARENLPKGVSVDARGLDKSLTALKKTLLQGGSRPSSKKALKKVSELQKKIKNGKIDLQSLEQYRPSINEAIDELGGFSSQVPYKYKPTAIRNLNQVKGEVIKTLSEYGNKFNPEFYKYHNASNEAYAAYAQSNKITKFLQEKIPFIPQSKAVSTLFSYGALTGVAGLTKLSPLTAAGAVAAASGYQAFKVLNRIKNSKVLAKYYGNVLKEATAENIPKTLRNLRALDEKMKKEEG
jgi:hypothetical protein